MLSTHSARLDFRAFADLVDALARTGEADLLLSGRGCRGARRCVAGYAPRTELAVEEGTRAADVEAFCFADGAPALGFLSYEYGLALRGVAGRKACGFPLGVLRKYGAYLEYDLETGRADVYGTDGAAVRALAALADAPPPASEFVPPAPATVAQSLDRTAYERGVARTLEHIRAGNTYQLNLSIRFARPAPDLDAAGLFRHLWLTRPAAFYALLRVPGHDIVSTSPERFLRVADGEVLSEPIKGTLAFDAYAPGLERRLRASLKESAELSMIVDLVRNDIAANCDYGAVRVRGHKSVFAVDRLLQMYSEVHGRLRADTSCVGLLLDAFPGGSVTGCPKRRSLEIIDELEPHTRGVYCGSVVLVRGERDMDSSIAIRTGHLDRRGGEFVFHAGSGIVVDSDPAAEYRETLAKAEKFLTLGA